MYRRKVVYLATIIVVLFLAHKADAQKYFTRTGEISFFSQSLVENIEAKSNSANTVFDKKTGQIQWAVLIKSFEFEKALMQDHFNENYMESSKYPKAKFSGEITNMDEIDLSKDGSYLAIISGTLEIHGVSKKIDTEAQFQVKDGKIRASSVLKVLVADFDIKIPAVVKDNIAKEIEIKINADYELFDKS